MSKMSEAKKKRRKNRIAQNKHNLQYNNVNKAAKKYIDSVVNHYKDGREKAPVPTVIEALSSESIENNKKISRMHDFFLKHFNEWLTKIAINEHAKISLPDIVLRFLIPLDFYISLGEPHDAGNYIVDKGAITYVSDTMVFSDIVPVGSNASIKVTFIAVHFCDVEVGNIARISDIGEMVDRMYGIAVREANKIISSYQAIPTRHNHYMHGVTRKSLPPHIRTTLFNRKSGSIIEDGFSEFHLNDISEIIQSRPLNRTELKQFETAYNNESFTNDEIFSLISKFNNAVNLRCMGQDADSIVLIDNFAELTIGYVLCEVCVYDGMRRQEVIANYVKMESMGTVWSVLADKLGIDSVIKLKTKVEYKEWYKHCRVVRNDIAHRFIQNNLSDRDSGNALYYTSFMTLKLCDIIMKRCDVRSECYDKMELLKSTVAMPLDMLNNYHD